MGGNITIIMVLYTFTPIDLDLMDQEKKNIQCGGDDRNSAMKPYNEENNIVDVNEKFEALSMQDSIESEITLCSWNIKGAAPADLRIDVVSKTFLGTTELKSDIICLQEVAASGMIQIQSQNTYLCTIQNTMEKKKVVGAHLIIWFYIKRKSLRS